jgi:hypothetical protein
MERWVSGDMHGAITLLVEGIDSLTDPKAEDALPFLVHHLPALCETTARYELGINYLDRCLPYFPNDLGTLYSRALLLMPAGRAPEARVALEQFQVECESSTDEHRKGWAEVGQSLRKQLTQLE